MTKFPEWLWDTPRYFYFLAALYFFAGIGLFGYDYVNLFTSESTDTYRRVIYLRVIYDAGREAAYLFGSGVMLHILLGIYAAARAQVETEAAE